MNQKTIEDRIAFIEEHFLPHLVSGRNTLPQETSFYASLENNVPEVTVDVRETPFSRELQGNFGKFREPRYFVSEETLKNIIKASSKEYKRRFGQFKSAYEQVAWPIGWKLPEKKIAGMWKFDWGILEVHAFYIPFTDTTHYFPLIRRKQS